MTSPDLAAATAARPDPAFSRLSLGTAPDSWGIWFPDDPKQPHWSTFLDEVVEAGFNTIELGPYGYLPTHPEQLKDELGQRGLTLTGGTVGTALHHGEEAFENGRKDAFAVCELLSAMDVHHLVVLPEQYTDLHTGALTQPSELTAEQWRDLVDGHSKLGRLVAEEFAVRAGFHPHVDTHVDTQAFIEKFLDDTDPETVSLCLDTGHVSYCSGDNREIISRYPDRISYIHLKQVDPGVAAQARTDRVGFYEAVQRGAMVEPPLGVPTMEPLLRDLAALGRDLRLIIEQDMYPAPPGSAKAIAVRTREYFAGIGLPPAVR
ncbi:TIM barrel protein [Rhodococcus pseudokoreensis]|uniref:TIM barrel protein n=1 Tax=Rhodococcus pseudokoreensis TaxID=2811421 RepID=A0A974WCK6_9NOCA|nr:sugar phosphate isomerase/epimerase [Rhodococcus pseudokoreensis]QSE95048.1 TIM barrel protein [Rhodococcus pseudokoreensis]